MNLGLKKEADHILTDESAKKYVLSEEERAYNFEKIKALKDINDDMKSKVVPFDIVDGSEP
jgi:hypothetical protein